MSDMAGGGAARRGGHAPLAVAVANGSLLGVGYLLIGRRRLALGTGLVTVVLLAFPRRIWFQCRRGRRAGVVGDAYRPRVVDRA
jgi:hypothetical protein